MVESARIELAFAACGAAALPLSYDPRKGKKRSQAMATQWSWRESNSHLPHAERRLSH